LYMGWTRARFLEGFIAMAQNKSEHPHQHNMEGADSDCQLTEPEKFRATQSKDETAFEHAAPGTIYTCPMHPEIRQDHPGSCPKCGMGLEPLMPSLEDDNPELKDFTRRFWW